jgi:hypothetical protein
MTTVFVVHAVPTFGCTSNFINLLQVSGKFCRSVCAMFCNLYSWMYKSHLCLTQGPALTIKMALKIFPFLLFSSI